MSTIQKLQSIVEVMESGLIDPRTPCDLCGELCHNVVACRQCREACDHPHEDHELQDDGINPNRTWLVCLRCGEQLSPAIRS